MNRFIRVLVGVCVLVFAQFSSAAIIPSDQYSLTALTGQWSWGQTDWNAYCSGQNVLDNVADLATVDQMLSDGYVDLSTDDCEGPFNGIYPWPVPEDFHSIEFEMVGGVNVSIGQLSFVSSRSYGDFTDITVDYAVDGGSWITAVATTSGDMGIATGPANTYTLDLGNVIADRFRITTQGEQVAFHEVMIDGEGGSAVLPVPTLNAWSLLLLSLLLAGAAWGRTRKLRA